MTTIIVIEKIVFGILHTLYLNKCSTRLQRNALTKNKLILHYRYY